MMWKHTFPNGLVGMTDCLEVEKQKGTGKPNLHELERAAPSLKRDP